MFIGSFAGKGGPVHALATIDHGICPPGYFTHIHSIEENRHK